jgi:HTH-type transcriptional regulator / antitoxin HigA
VTSEKAYSTPGQLIQELLNRRGWSQQVLAIILRADQTGINRMIAGKRPVDAEMAIQLGEVFGVDPKVFLELQQSYDLAKARIVTRPDPDREKRATLFGDLPVAEMIKRRWLDAENVRDIPRVESSLINFFGVDSLNDIPVLPFAAKKTNVFSPATPVQIAWLYRVHQIAKEMIVPKFSRTALRESLPILSRLLSAPELARKVPRILAEAGIRYVIVESLTSARIDGVCCWLNEDSPVIGMSLRHDRIDNFWFVLRHEIEHVLRQHGRSDSCDMLDVDLEGERAGTGEAIAEEERVANDAAQDFCVPRKSLDSFIARKAPFFAERDLLGFAASLNIHPGLVAGQLQHRTSRYDRFRNHLVKIRSAVAPSAIVDGWGDVAPIGV